MKNIIRESALLLLCIICVLICGCENGSSGSSDSGNHSHSPANPDIYPEYDSHEVYCQLAIVVLYDDYNISLEGVNVTFYSRRHSESEFCYLSYAMTDENGYAISAEEWDCLVPINGDFLSIKAEIQLDGFESVVSEEWFVDSETLTRYIYLSPYYKL